MTRNLKALGLSLVAVFALSALVASAAQAEVHHTLRTSSSTGSAFVEAEAESTQVFEPAAGAGVNVSCTGVSTETGTVTDKSTESTGRPIYTGCTSSLGSATVNTAGCHYTFTGTTNANEHAVVHLSACTNGGITISTAGCNMKVPNEQTLTGIHYTNVTTAGGRKDVTIHATVTGIKTTETNFICHLGGINDGETGTYTGTVQTTGFKDNAGVKEGAVDLSMEELTSTTMP
jgi:hypothetical protein